MHDMLANPPRPHTPVRTRTPRQVVNALTTQMRLQPDNGTRSFGWTVEISGMSDSDLDTVVAMLRRRGLRTEYVRELDWFAHFTLRW